MEVIINSSLCQGNQERGELKTLRRRRKTSSRIHILKSTPAEFALLRELVGGIPWQVAESPSSEFFPNPSRWRPKQRSLNSQLILLITRLDDFMRSLPNSVIKWFHYSFWVLILKALQITEVTGVVTSSQRHSVKNNIPVKYSGFYRSYLVKYNEL